MMGKNEAKPQDCMANLADYVKVLIKRGRLVLCVFLTSVVVAVGVTLVTPKFYRATALLEVGGIGSGNDQQLAEDLKQLAAKLTGNAYQESVAEALGIGKGSLPGIKPVVQSGALVSIAAESSDPQRAKSALEETVKLVIADHETSLKEKEDLAKEEIKRLRNKIKSLESEKKVLSAKVTTLQKIPTPQRSTGEHYALFDTKEQLETTKQDIEDLYMEVNVLRGSLEDIAFTKAVKAPDVGDSPVRPKLTLNVATAAVLGLFLGVFLAFAKEWWAFNSKQILP